ncbi:Monooxygenase FAD-binding [Penicillium psychrosexuale]|uniref:Monooxygenase FAD-binding n=1 Tax=Penicillium psychrosexuale TaxID=1002107 RepID=UPI00254519BA|nr:Monooxygenase FAD-binding [Penicillium psychrosexuale]KAJ5795838.1 Monooxygenase FAD-binding [Penicillium psychrosexuale]
MLFGRSLLTRIIQFLHVGSMYPIWTLPLPTWERDGVVLVGDAAHVLPSSSGQCSSQALEDVEAFVLFLAHYLRMNDVHRDKVASKAQKNAIKAAARQGKTQNSKLEMGIFKEYSVYSVVLTNTGLFPSFMSNQIRAVTEYNIADHVA